MPLSDSQFQTLLSILPHSRRPCQVPLSKLLEYISSIAKLPPVPLYVRHIVIRLIPLRAASCVDEETRARVGFSEIRSVL